MPFETYENSVEGSRPVELYIFTYQSQVYRYTSDSEDIEVLGAEYTNMPGLARGPIEDTGSVSKSSLNITAPIDFPPSLLFEVYPPSGVVTLEIRRVQRSDLTDPKTFWLGRVLNATWSTGASQLMCESLFTRLKQPGLRRIYSKNCPHLLYGEECRADPDAFVELVVLDGVATDGFSISAPAIDAQPDGYFDGGMMKWDNSGEIISRGITTHIGDSVTLTHPIVGLTAGQTIQMFPGCDRTKPVCVAKFNNVVNYGGFPYIPQKNPFGQNSVF
jgi:uncharacterized phage protein (TIGR02218 family)